MKMNKEELLVNIEVAELLNEFDYTEGSTCCYNEGKLINLGFNHAYINGGERGTIEAPTFEEVHKWLRDNYKISISVYPVIIKDNSIRFNFKAFKCKNKIELLYVGGNEYSYEDAFNYGLKVILTEILKKQ